MEGTRDNIINNGKQQQQIIRELERDLRRGQLISEFDENDLNHPRIELLVTAGPAVPQASTSLAYFGLDSALFVDETAVRKLISEKGDDLSIDLDERHEELLQKQAVSKRIETRTDVPTKESPNLEPDKVIRLNKNGTVEVKLKNRVFFSPKLLIPVEDLYHQFKALQESAAVEEKLDTLKSRKEISFTSAPVNHEPLKLKVTKKKNRMPELPKEKRALNIPKIVREKRKATPPPEESRPKKKPKKKLPPLPVTQIALLRKQFLAAPAPAFKVQRQTPPHKNGLLPILPNREPTVVAPFSLKTRFKIPKNKSKPRPETDQEPVLLRILSPPAGPSPQSSVVLTTLPSIQQKETPQSLMEMRLSPPSEAERSPPSSMEMRLTSPSSPSEAEQSPQSSMEMRLSPPSEAEHSPPSSMEMRLQSPSQTPPSSPPAESTAPSSCHPIPESTIDSNNLNEDDDDVIDIFADDYDDDFGL